MYRNTNIVCMCVLNWNELRSVFLEGIFEHSLGGWYFMVAEIFFGKMSNGM